MNNLILYLIALVVVFVTTVLILRKLIPFLKSKKMGQKILDIGPRWHKGKEGTPTMGGLSFIIPIMIIGLLGCIYISITQSVKESLPLVLTLAYGLACGLIGCIDDSAKIRKAKNEGLTAPQKFILQVAASAIYLFLLTLVRGVNTELYIPFWGQSIDFGVFYYLIALLLLVGVNNSVNLTDGIDGLSSSVTLVCGVFFTAASLMEGLDGADTPLMLLGALVIGGCAGFLVYNFYPAKVFMGDTGSLFLGGLVAGGAFMMNKPLIVIIFGIVYIIETASVMLQVGYFKLTHGKRLFKMSPIHHHFEKCGWSEIKIVAVFSTVAAIASVIALVWGIR